MELTDLLNEAYPYINWGDEEMVNKCSTFYSKVPRGFWDILAENGTCALKLFKTSGLRPWCFLGLLDTFEKVSEGVYGWADLDIVADPKYFLPNDPPETFDSFAAAVRVLLSLVTYSQRYPNRQRADLPRWAACILMEFLDRCFSNPHFCTMFLGDAMAGVVLDILGHKCTELSGQALRALDSNKDHLVRFLGYAWLVSNHVECLLQTHKALTA
jgi:hypothetical protein